MFPRRINILDSSKITQLISIQKEELRESFINNFGDKFLRVYFKNIVKNSNNYLFVIKDRSRIIGFAIVCKNSRKFASDIIKKDFLRIVFYCLSDLIRNQGLVKKIINEIYSNKKTEKFQAELLYIAVSKNYQKMGFGKKLIIEINKTLKREGVRRYLVGTRADNRSSNAFYKHLGFKYSFSAELFEEDYNYYFFDL